MCFILTRTPVNDKVYTSSYARFVNTTKKPAANLYKIHKKGRKKSTPAFILLIMAFDFIYCVICATW